MWQASIYPVLGLGNETNDSAYRSGASRIIVRQGENLWLLAKKYQTTVDELVKLNQVKHPDRIEEGQYLWVPNLKTKDNSDGYVTLDVKVKKSENLRVAEKEEVPWWVTILRCVPAFATISKQTFNTEDLGSLAPKDTGSKVQTYEIYVNPQEAGNTKAVSALSSDTQTLSRGLGRLASNEEIELLSRVIYGEARGEDFTGQVAVGAVVLNRLKDPRFPKTIKGIIYQSGAFTAVDDRQIHLNPDDQACKAAEAALSGLDPTNGALFYYNPKTATDKWIKSRTVVKRIGNHTFSI
ncbi:putative cell wall hydrolase [Desulfosporosinus orientis DSM 765]|uniref:Putative cell wall hydrolase n=1 Tax=Desulfosporosinus orientis (strain ATCC 19365 / DSM 765 / NCIMB 8382 / VKM B-1628 / Singapore I) TaxID=768706 RepID=G7WC59_DESOD|nr:putative cell wall hydrolase [Desulfosporosinus orientis DSM 765]